MHSRLSWDWLVLAICCVFSIVFQLHAQAVPVGADASINVPILMYHSLLKDPARANSYTVSPAVFERDLRYLSDHGYQTIVMEDLISYVYQGVPLPEKPVIITFDDGHLNNLTYALPLLQKHGAKAVLSVVGAYVEDAVAQADPNPAYAYVTWEDISLLHASGCFEIQNHTFDLHSRKHAKGAARLDGEVASRYEARLTGDVLKMQNALKVNCDLTPTTFTYPFGYIDKEGERILKELGFLATLSCEERPNPITRDPACLYLLGRYNRPATLTTEAYMKRALRGTR